MTNRIGSSTLPCGIPLVTACGCPFRITIHYSISLFPVHFIPIDVKSFQLANRRLNSILCNKELQYSNKEKDIGVVVDNQLNFEDHMNEKINKANSIIGLIRDNGNNIFFCKKYCVGPRRKALKTIVLHTKKTSDSGIKIMPLST
jgi:hypothetical protein